MKLTKALLLVGIMTIANSPLAQAAQKNDKAAKQEQKCEYLKDKKEAAEDAMRNGYAASQYDKLEAKRKHWKKQYIEQCF